MKATVEWKNEDGSKIRLCRGCCEKRQKTAVKWNLRVNYPDIQGDCHDCGVPK